MGAGLGVSASTVMLHWQANGLKPHIVAASRCRELWIAEKLEDIVAGQSHGHHGRMLRSGRPVRGQKDVLEHECLDSFGG